MDINIRKQVESDHERVFQINQLAFKQQDEGKLVELLRKSQSFIPELSLVAEHNGKVIGHILFSKIKIIDCNQRQVQSLALAPVSVLPEHQNKGIGTQLIKEGLKIAKNLGYKSAIVLGHEQYYPKFGFKPASLWDIKCPYQVSDQYFMAIQLMENGLQGVKGLVKYPKQFDIVS